MAADKGRVYPQELHLLQKEIEVQGDLLNQEQLERQSEIDDLRLELNALKRQFEQLYPGFLKDFAKFYEREKEIWNPDLNKQKA